MNVLQLSLSACALIGFTVIVRFLCIGRIPSDVRNVLWTIVCCKLMLPFPVPVLPLCGVAATGQMAGTISQDAWMGELPWIPRGVFLGAGAVPAPMALWWKPLWLAGAVLFGLTFLCGYIRSMRVFAMSVPVEGNGLICQWQASRRLHRPVAVRMSDRIHTPLSYGIFRPVILLPKGMDGEDGQGLLYILEHELAHIRNWDCARKLCLAAVLAIHWFNPLVWVMYFLANRDMELACDERVVRAIGEGGRAGYARFLVDWAAGYRGVTGAGCLIPYFGKKDMRERIVNIMKIRKKSLAGMALSLALVCGALTVYAATPAEATQQDTPTLVRREPVVAAVVSPEGIGAWKPQMEDPTLGGLFALYTPEEYEKVIENVRKYADGTDGSGTTTDEVADRMEEDLERLKADGGKGEFVIYKSAFDMSWEEDGYSMHVGFDPTIVMAPQLAQRDTELTAESYRQDIEDVRKGLESFLKDGALTEAQMETILAKMNENLAELEALESGEKG